MVTKNFMFLNPKFFQTKNVTFLAKNNLNFTPKILLFLHKTFYFLQQIWPNLKNIKHFWKKWCIKFVPKIFFCFFYINFLHLFLHQFCKKVRPCAKLCSFLNVLDILFIYFRQFFVSKSRMLDLQWGKWLFNKVNVRMWIFARL